MRQHTEETKAKMRAAWTPEKRAAAKERMRSRIANTPNWNDRLKGINHGPKSEHTKELMRLAKLDVKKSEEHRAAMSIAHKRRGQILSYIRAKFDCTFKEACQILKENREVYYGEDC